MTSDGTCYGDDNCTQPIRWIRGTQFAGKHTYCAKHAEMENDFLMSDDCTYWEEVKAP